MQYAFVVDKNKQPLAPCHPARARQLLRDGKAAVFRKYPFTIILKEREGRVAVRATGSCNITTPKSTIQGINVKHLTILHMSDGYSYLTNKKGDGAPPVLP